MKGMVQIQKRLHTLLAIVVAIYIPTTTKAFDPSLTDWFSEAGYGVMVHWTTYTQPESGSMKSYFDAVENFDVEAFASQLEEAGAGYVIFTISHRDMYLPFPNAALDSVLPGRTCQTRDLMSDLYDALHPRGIKMMFYYANIAINGYDPAWYAASKYGTDSNYFAQLMYDITSEIGARYGDKLAGWWLDNLHEYLNMDDKFGDFTTYNAALKMGNPNRIVTYNFSGTRPWNTSKPYGIQDYQAGETESLDKYPSSRYAGQCGSQWHACANMDYGTIPWFYDGTRQVAPNYSNEAVNNYIRSIMVKGGVFSYNAANYQEGPIDGDTMNQLRVVKRAMRAVEEGGVHKVDGYNPKISYTGAWSHISQASNYNNSVSYSSTASNTMEYAFNGTSVKLYTKKGPGAGIFDVLLDGNLVTTFDSYSSAGVFQVIAYQNASLSAGTHTIKMVVKGSKNASSSGYICHLDYIAHAPIQRIFTVVSAHGTPSPAVGSTMSDSGTVVNATLAGSPVVAGSTQYLATGWIGTGSLSNGSGTNTSFTITQNSTVLWQWQTNYWVELNASGSSGTLDRASGWFQAGTNLTVTAFPHTYSDFDHWAGDTNGAAVAGGVMAFAVTSNRSVTAVFRQKVTQTNAVPYQWLADQGWTNDFEIAVTNDADHDGFTTAQEYWAGTDPTNGESFLQLDEMVLTSTNIRLVWAHARVDANLPPISIQTRANLLTGDWLHVGQKLPVDGTNTWDSPLPDHGYFRLCATNSP